MNKGFEEIIARFSDQKVLCIGDVMLDRYVHGEVKRTAPESNAPILSNSRNVQMPGGAGNVAMNLASMGAQVTIAGVVGEDLNADALKEVFKQQKINVSGLITATDRPTISKTRFVDGQTDHLIRFDEEEIKPIDMPTEKAILDIFTSCQFGAVILSDYAKGVLTDNLIASVIVLAKEKNIPVLVDPKGADWSKYKGATLLTPNVKELSVVAGRALEDEKSIKEAAANFIKDASLAALLVTRSEKGMSLFQKDAEAALNVEANVAGVAEVSGAGDSVIAAMAVSLAAGATFEEAIKIANLSGNLSVEETGTTKVTAASLKNNLQRMDGKKPQSLSQRKVTQSWNTAEEQVRSWQEGGLKVGFTNGCFDIVHVGHVSCLEQARAQCDKLVLGLNHDESVRILKGPTRPVNDEQARAGVMTGLASIDLVVLFGAEEAGQDNTPAALLEVLRPDIFFKGGDYTIEQIPEAAVVLEHGGEVNIMSLFDGYSTTNIIKKVNAA